MSRPCLMRQATLVRKGRCFQMRKFMTKEVQFTLVKSAKMELVAGMPKAIPLNDLTVMGKINQDKALKEVQELHGSMAMVYKVEHFTKTYKMSVEEFVQLAEEVNPDTEVEEEEEDNEDDGE